MPLPGRIEFRRGARPWRIVTPLIATAALHGVAIPMAHGDNRGSFKWTPPIADLDRDLARLKPRRPVLDREGSERDLALAQEIFGDILPARRHPERDEREAEHQKP